MQRTFIARYGLLALVTGAIAVPVQAGSVPPLLYPQFVSFTAGASQLDLVVTGRRLAHEQGMREARDTVEMLAGSQDSSDGVFERDLVRAAREESYQVPAALESLPLADAAAAGDVSRADVAFWFVNGLAQAPGSRGAVLLADAVAHLRSKGFAAEILTTSPYASTEHNAGLLLPELRERLARASTKHVIIVAVSKGVHDFLEALAQNRELPAPSLSPEELDKIKLVVSMSGIVRSSAVAGWIVHSNGLAPRVIRTFMRSHFGKFPNLDGVESLTRDPWARLLATGGAPLRCPWVNFVVFPDGSNGQPKVGFLRTRLLRLLRGASEIGPFDGLTESASSLLPPGTNLEQWVVRIRGAHGMVNGRYLDGTPVVARGGGVPATQIVDPLLKAIPIASLVARRPQSPRRPEAEDLEAEVVSP